jgi:hypothetical protein
MWFLVGVWYQIATVFMTPKVFGVMTFLLNVPAFVIAAVRVIIGDQNLSAATEQGSCQGQMTAGIATPVGELIPKGECAMPPNGFRKSEPTASLRLSFSKTSKSSPHGWCWMKPRRPSRGWSSGPRGWATPGTHALASVINKRAAHIVRSAGAAHERIADLLAILCGWRTAIKPRGERLRA